MKRSRSRSYRRKRHRKDGLTVEFDKLKEIIAEVLSVDPNEITEETTFMEDLGADSLDLFQIAIGIEEAFQLELQTKELETVLTVGDALRMLKNATGERE